MFLTERYRERIPRRPFGVWWSSASSSLTASLSLSSSSLINSRFGTIMMLMLRGSCNRARGKYNTKDLRYGKWNAKRMCECKTYREKEHEKRQRLQESWHVSVCVTLKLESFKCCFYILLNRSCLRWLVSRFWLKYLGFHGKI